MPTTIRNIRGTDLSPDILRKANINPDRFVTIIVEDGEEDVRDLKQEKSRWAKLTEEIEKDSPLRGASEEAIKLSKEFRQNFSF